MLKADFWILPMPFLARCRFFPNTANWPCLIKKRQNYGTIALCSTIKVDLAHGVPILGCASFSVSQRD
ncbi:hypothetical protein CFter6_4223 [Collimonas fungivorans]|jgi:hypothetical protein|uniref:Uncharacterized protein n=1 Tax=Collimonas fungivorans TaxID=158899 RepID=A0A127PGS7_9BURK|nr:hypothetical protein CFter6_4223 [Collimonas fungivorans]